MITENFSAEALGKLLSNRQLGNNAFRPLFFRMDNLEDRERLVKLLKERPHIKILDSIEEQLGELMKSLYPAESRVEQRLQVLVDEHLAGKSPLEYGVWVYYPWSEKIVHTLDEEEFVAVRTNRNMYKISPKEIATLKTKVIGVIGLSVGQAIALTLAMERTCGEIRLADFDGIELSNLNRIRVGVQDLGVNKAIAAARQIAELDPFIEVKCYTSGIGLGNINDFLTEGGKLDVLVEECDGIDVKILSRIKARALGIPVVMDTNDKGMLDIERFDIDGERFILHGKVKELENLPEDKLLAKLGTLTTQEKVSYLSEIIGMENVSEAMIKSLGEMGKTITGWPQLASAVVLGGAMVTDVCRRILTNRPIPSGRYFVDFDELIK